MEIKQIKQASEIHQDKETVLVLGYFDALHRGHHQLFLEAEKIAKEQDLEVVVLTFPENPQLAFKRFESELLLHITSPEKRCQKFEEYGVDRLFLIPFTTTFAKLTSAEFVKQYVSTLKAKAIVVGFDYHFGTDRKSAKDLKDLFSGQVVTVEEQMEYGEKISSTRIRELIQTGDVKTAEQLLGYPYTTRGIVVHGDARGRTIGFPTANMAPLDRTFLPSDGVYVTEVKLDGKTYRSMTSLGKNMTFDGLEQRLETHIFNFEGDIYGETLEVIWIEKIREMVKFNQIDDLINQLKADKSFALNYKKI